MMTTQDSTDQLIREADEAVFSLAKRYRSSTGVDTSQLRIQLERAERKLFDLRMEALSQDISVTSNDIEDIRRIGQAIESAATTQALIGGAIQLTAKIAGILL